MSYSPIDQKFLYLKHEVFTRIMEKVLLLLEREKISLSESRKMSIFVLDSIHLIKNADQMSSFLNELKKRWEDFSDIHTLQVLSSHKQDESRVIKKLESFINSSQSN